MMGPSAIERAARERSKQRTRRQRVVVWTGAAAGVVALLIGVVATIVTITTRHPVPPPASAWSASPTEASSPSMSVAQPTTPVPAIDAIAAAEEKPPVVAEPSPVASVWPGDAIRVQELTLPHGETIRVGIRPGDVPRPVIQLGDALLDLLAIRAAQPPIVVANGTRPAPLAATTPIAAGAVVDIVHRLQPIDSPASAARAAWTITRAIDGVRDAIVVLLLRDENTLRLAALPTAFGHLSRVAIDGDEIVRTSQAWSSLLNTPRETVPVEERYRVVGQPPLLQPSRPTIGLPTSAAGYVGYCEALIHLDETATAATAIAEALGWSDAAWQARFPTDAGHAEAIARYRFALTRLQGDPRLPG